MIKKFALTVLVLLMPVLAHAGLVEVGVSTGSGSGTSSVTSGYFAIAKPIIFTPAAGYIVSLIKNNGVPVYTNSSTPGAYTYTPALSNATQVVLVSFTQPPAAVTPYLVASAPSVVNALPGIAQAIGGQTSTISGLGSTGTAKFKWTATPAGAVFNPISSTITNAANIITSFTAPSGVYTATLTLSSNLTPAAGSVLSTNVTVNVSGTNNSTCLACHAGQPAAVAFPTSIHGESINPVVTCQSCHVGDHPATQASGGLQCTPCHATFTTIDTATPTYNLATCASCHVPAGGEPLHSFQTTATALGANSQSCVYCHASAIYHPGTQYVNDNTGVRAITGVNGEFDASTRNNVMGYRSHHIYNGVGVDPQDAQCLACHLEGMVGPNRTVVIDPTNHMVDGNVHLRSGNTAISANFLWNPASPNHSGMDNFCMSCHNALGAVSAYANMSSALKGMTPIAGALQPSPTNPFGDQLTNAYDQMTRPAVVDVYDQFGTTNTSHHAVRGAKYSGRTRIASATRPVKTPAVFTQYSGAGNADIHLNAAGTLMSYAVFGNYSVSDIGAHGISSSGQPSGTGPLYPGSRQTMYDSNLFVANYTTLNGNTLGDDSTLHCGDCHSVGQWKPGSASAITWNNTSTASGGYTVIATTAAIGAHGSQNEYMLRTSNGTDSLQVQSSTGSTTKIFTNGNYVCFLCHTQMYYGDNSAVAQSNLILGINAVRGDFGHGGAIGPCNGNAYSGYGKKGTARYGVLTNGTAQPAIGNIFAMACAHCHNSGDQVFGGIHGSSKNGAVSTYVSYSTNGLEVAGSTKAANDASQSAYLLNIVHKNSYRFMGGVSNRYNGGSTPGRWESQAPVVQSREGCYNLSQTTDATHLWNTTTPKTAAAGATNAVVNNGGNDSAFGATDYSYRTAQNNTTSGWGSCNHHQGSTTTGPTAPTRVIQRPLVY